MIFSPSNFRLKGGNAFLFAATLATYSMLSMNAAELEFASVFGDHMVIQQETEAALWGKAKPNEKLSVKVGWSNETFQLKSNAEGNWKILIPTPKTKSKSHTITLQSGLQKKTLKDVLLGEVWICGGQSNMQWKMRGFGVNHFAEELKKAHLPHIRLAQVERQLALDEQERVPCSWRPCTKNSALSFSVVGYFFGKELHEELNVPIGLVSANWGGSSAESWISEKALEPFPHYNKVLLTHAEVERSTGISTSDKKIGNLNQKSSSLLYNGMLKPIIPMAFKGVIWYQGESNVEEPIHYRTLFPALIEDWRTQWGRGDFPFYYVQIAPFKYKQSTHAALLREAQLTALREPNTGIAITMDIGDASNIHPKEKKPVASRLARLALSRTYGKDYIDDASPLFSRFEKKAHTMVIHFDHAKSGLQSRNGEELSCFIIAGVDQRFVEAKATIVGDTVVVHSSEVSNPIAVRFGWGNADKPNLENKEGLPASSFRTDSWPIPQKIENRKK
ncbi:sialate O-acetylesterase [Akkermansiaceae bacterium]|nr:sialate O-acetylesterase [Akkermansiaceae bacterium]